MTYLVQRIVSRKNPNKKGVDGHFEFDYMGSAEFEFGALGKALAELRQLRKNDVTISQHSDFWVVATAEGLKPAIDFIVDQKGPKKLRLKEWSGMHMEAFHGWWCIDPGACWLVFRRKEQARMWVDLVWKDDEDAR